MSDSKCGLGVYLLKDKFLCSDDAPMHQNTIFTRLRKYEFDRLAIYIYADGLMVISLNNMIMANLGDNVKGLAKNVFYVNLVSFLLNVAASERRIDYPNSSSLFSSLLEHTHLNSLQLSSEDDFLTVNRRFCNYDNPNSAQYQKRFECNYFPERRIPIGSVDDFMALFCGKLEVVLKNDELAHLILILQKSMIAHGEIKLDVSSALSWLVIERVLYQMWKEYITRKERHKALKDNRDYTASIKSNILLMAGEIDRTMFDGIEDARKQRNKIMHGDYNLFSDDLVDDFEKSSWESFMTACALIQKYYAFRLELRPGISLQL